MSASTLRFFRLFHKLVASREIYVAMIGSALHCQYVQSHITFSHHSLHLSGYRYYFGFQLLVVVERVSSVKLLRFIFNVVSMAVHLTHAL